MTAPRFVMPSVEEVAGDSYEGCTYAITDLSDGFVTIPGGVGTMDELWEAMSWAQLGLHLFRCLG